MTWNLWWQFGDWQDRQPVIDQVIAEADADVVCLQEVYATDSGDQFARLRDKLGYHGFATAAPSGRARFGNALLSRTPITEHDQLRLPGADGSPGHRSALFGVVSGHALPVTVVCTHLDWRYNSSRLRQAQLEAIVAELPPASDDHLVLLAGDFNAVPNSDEMRRLTGLAPGFEDSSGRTAVFTDSWAAVGEGPGFTWTRQNPNSRDAQWPRRRLDSVLVGWPRPKPFGNPIRAVLAGESESADGVVGSDHYAVVVDLDSREPFPHD